MIGRLHGRVIAQEEEGTLVIDVMGVGYEAMAPLGTLGRVHPDADGKATLFVHTHVREDVLALYAFATAADRTAFRTLIGVSNVGPKTAVAVLSSLPALELARALAAKDLAALTKIPGIGKKTAERLLLELRDKLSADIGPPATPEGPRPPSGSKPELLKSALTRLGYRPAEAERVVAGLAPEAFEAALPDLVKEALALLSK